MEDNDSGVFRLVYKSRSLIAPDHRTTELGAIFTQARTNNRAAGITGALLVSHEAFVQALEGDERAVRDLYTHIRRDERHEDVALLEAGPAEGRVFGRWAMAKVATDGGPDIPLLSNASRGTIVVAREARRQLAPEQETVLAFMRGSIARDLLEI